MFVTPAYAQAAGGGSAIASFVPLILIFAIMYFLLMPALVPCKHPPPPMANQIILVEYPPGLDMSFDPFFVTGTLTPEVSLEIGIQAQYRMQAREVSSATHPDVRN